MLDLAQFRRGLSDERANERLALVEDDRLEVIDGQFHLEVLLGEGQDGRRVRGEDARGLALLEQGEHTREIGEAVALDRVPNLRL